MAGRPFISFSSKISRSMDNYEGAGTEFRHRPTHNDVTLLSASLASNASVVDGGIDTSSSSSSAVAATDPATAIGYQENVPSPIHSTLRRMASRGSSGSNATSTHQYNAMTNYDHANEDGHLISSSNSNSCDAPARERPADGNWPTRESLSFTRSLIFYGAGAITQENEMAARNIQEARLLRKKYFGGEGVVTSISSVLADTLSSSSSSSSQSIDDSVTPAATPSAATGDHVLEYVFGTDGVVEIYAASDFKRTHSLITVPPLSTFITDYHRLISMISSGAMRSFSFQRLQMLSSAFKMHMTINGAQEDEAQSELLGTDFYRTMKVDNHIHLAAAASAKQFVNFVRTKLETEGHTVVMPNGQTLQQVFQTAGLDLDHLTIDAFSVLADYSSYQRFDNFNDKFSPFRMAQMRQIFLKTDNHINGR